MKHGSLFSGIGGFDLAAEWMGWENVFHCEKNEFCQRVLRYYWPNAISYEDVTQTDFTRYSGQIDILTGGFPCQPYSTAGKRKGKEDDRHLWPAMLRAIREISPRYVVGENVRGLLSWNGGLVFHEVQSDLEAEGYDVLPFLLPAASVNAPHERYRIWFIAFSANVADASIEDDRRSVRKEVERQESESGSGAVKDVAPNPCDCLHAGELDDRRNSTAPTGGEGKHQQQNRRHEVGEWIRAEPCTSCSDATNSPSGGRIQNHREAITKQLAQRVPDWREFPAQSPVCNGNDGLPPELDGITIPKHRRETIKAGGNAVVPPLVYQIFKAIEETQLIITQ